jgi:adenylate kinase
VPATFDKSLIESVRKVVQSGGLVDDNIVINILKEKLKQPESQKGVILDGVPRTLAQLDLYEKAGLKTDLVINITLN